MIIIIIFIKDLFDHKTTPIWIRVIQLIITSSFAYGVFDKDNVILYTSLCVIIIFNIYHYLYDELYGGSTKHSKKIKKNIITPINNALSQHNNKFINTKKYKGKRGTKNNNE